MDQVHRPIFRLPNELLIKVFRELEDDEASKDNGGPDIKICRLVCRRFCDLSSHLLLRSVQVGHTFASVARLDAITRHPLISRGISTIEVVLSSYHSFFSTDPEGAGKQAFIEFQLKELTQRVQLFEVGKFRNISKTDAVILRKAHEVLSCWRYLMRESFPVPQQPPRGDLDLHRALVNNAYNEFQRLIEEQQSLVEQGGVGEAVASALARMPWVHRLEFDDTRQYGFPRRGLSRATSDTVFDGIYQNTLLPLIRRSDIDVMTTRQYPILSEIVPRVLAAVGGSGITQLKSVQANVEFIQFDEDVSDIHKRIVTATKQLTDFSISQDANFSFSSSGVEIFLELCLQSPALRTCSISLPAGEFGIRPFLAGTTRKDLTVIELDGAEIRLSDLKIFLRIIPDVLDRLELTNIVLVGGTWREALDMLREKTYRDSKTSPYHYPVRIYSPLNHYSQHLPSVKKFASIFESDGTWDISHADAYVMRHAQVNPFERLVLVGDSGN
ncbi:hypothetical protein B0T21DRAFT_402948 [Apiosordaria backusii]|uniref:F-box domain-containing protein n=1 Tax=Apiosordaria backusii TaxID=314023 RepID=A0AA40B7A3_9PEZI|nr:hypothetical protein B0T21DRAFT_402948 [Apiosordaria backusii]